jgi:hypothetical protein
MKRLWPQRSDRVECAAPRHAAVSSAPEKLEISMGAAAGAAGASIGGAGLSMTVRCEAKGCGRADRTRRRKRGRHPPFLAYASRTQCQSAPGSTRAGSLVRCRFY